MFKNIGKKIKVLAVVFCVLGIIGSLIAGGTLLDGWGTEAIGAAIMIGGSLLSWISSFVLYGFGELVDNSTIIANSIKEKTYETISEVSQNNNMNLSNTVLELTNCKRCGQIKRIDTMHRDNDGKYICQDCYNKEIL